MLITKYFFQILDNGFRILYDPHNIYQILFKKLLNFWNVILIVYKTLFFQILDNDF